jgi:hypothetical protein
VRIPVRPEHRRASGCYYEFEGKPFDLLEPAGDRVVELVVDAIGDQ